jgi:hypothetical protein
MNHFKSGLPHLKWGLLALLLGSAAGIATIVLSQSLLSAAQQVHDAAEHKLANTRRDMQAALDDQQNMASYAQEYSLLLQRGIIGDEQRLDWIDELERLRHRGLVLDFSYTIAPQQPYRAPLALDTGNFDLRRSDMTLSLDLLHAGQLVNFFHALRTDGKGWFMLDGCSIDRLTGNAAETGTPGITPLLRAECKGGWLTLHNRSTS